MLKLTHRKRQYLFTGQFELLLDIFILMSIVFVWPLEMFSLQTNLVQRFQFIRFILDATNYTLQRWNDINKHQTLTLFEEEKKDAVEAHTNCLCIERAAIRTPNRFDFSEKFVRFAFVCLVVFVGGSCRDSVKWKLRDYKKRKSGEKKLPLKWKLSAVVGAHIPKH